VRREEGRGEGGGGREGRGRGGGEERERKREGREEERGGREGEQRLKPNSHVILYISTTCHLGSHDYYQRYMTVT